MTPDDQIASLSKELSDCRAERDAARAEAADLHQRLRDSSDSRSRLIWRVNHTEAERDEALAKLAEVEKEFAQTREGYGGAVIAQHAAVSRAEAAERDARDWNRKWEASEAARINAEAERDALKSRLDALENPDDEDARTPAGLRAANAQLRKDRQMYSALVGQLRGQLQECEAWVVQMREAIGELQPCKRCGGSGTFLDTTYNRTGELTDCGTCFGTGQCGYSNWPKIVAALSTTTGTALLEELRSLREAKDVKPETTRK